MRKRIDYIDFLNVFASFCVVYLHCSSSVFEYGVVENRVWILSMLIQTLAHTAVPIFFMITGATLLEYREKYDTKTFFKKRFLRTGIPFLFWTCVYMLWPFITEGAEMPGTTAWRDGFFNNGSNIVFWFFYALWGIYLCIPVFSLIAKEEHKKIMEYICLLYFIFMAVYPFVTRFILPVYWEIRPNMLTGYMGYIFFGWVILKEQYTKRTRGLIYLAGIAGAFLMFFGTCWLSQNAGALDRFYMEYHSLACMPMSVALMLFAKHLNWEKVYDRVPKGMVKKIAGAGFGIYIIHMMFIMQFEKNEWVVTHPMYWMVFGPVVVYMLSLTVVLILQKIPGIRKLIP